MANGNGTIADYAGKPATILIVDDSKLTREMLRMGLERHGHHVITAENGRTAMELLDRENQVDLIMLDLVMPDMDGFEFLDWRAAHPESKTIPVIVSSSLDDFGAITKALSMDCTDYFTKPLNNRDMEITLPLKIRNAVSNRRLMLQTRLQNQILNRELEIAARYQQFLLPREIDLQGMDVAWHFEPCSGVGGDYFDFMRLDDERYAIVVADVSGHGVASAMTAAILKALILGYFENFTTTCQMLGMLNEDLVRLTPADVFVTAFAGIFDRGAARFSWSLGGHPHPVFMPNDSPAFLMGGPSNLLGVFDSGEMDLELAHGEQTVRTGDRLFIYTDGLTESTNRQGELFGNTRLVKLVEQTRGMDAEQAKGTIWNNLSRFSGGEFNDDVAFIIMDFLP